MVNREELETARNTESPTSSSAVTRDATRLPAALFSITLTSVVRRTGGSSVLVTVTVTRHTEDLVPRGSVSATWTAHGSIQNHTLTRSSARATGAESTSKQADGDDAGSSVILGRWEAVVRKGEVRRVHGPVTKRQVCGVEVVGTRRRLKGEQSAEARTSTDSGKEVMVLSKLRRAPGATEITPVVASTLHTKWRNTTKNKAWQGITHAESQRHSLELPQPTPL